MNKYIKIQREREKRFNSFPIKFAFSKKQLEDVLVEWNVGLKDIQKIAGGGFIRKKDKGLIDQFLKDTIAEDEQLLKDDDYVFSMFKYELSNHEYCVTYDATDAIEACGLKPEEVYKDKRLTKIFQKAKDDYLDNVIGW